VSDSTRPRPLSLNPTRCRAEFVDSPDQRIENVLQGRQGRLPNPRIRHPIPAHYHVRPAFLRRLLERFSKQFVHSKSRSCSDLANNCSLSTRSQFLKTLQVMSLQLSRPSADSSKSVLLHNSVSVTATSMAATAMYVKLTVNYVNTVNVHFTRFNAVDNAD
jgi:hypothetical protein